MSQSHFFAHLSRLKLINRWPLMRNVRTENVSEHSLQVAMVAHALAAIKNRKFGGQVNAERIALLAMYHDASEVLTGDLPTPVKYFNSQIAQEYKAIEKIAQQKLVDMVPDELRDIFEPLIDEHHYSEEEQSIVKQADALCAYLKCLEEQSAGNNEFLLASFTNSTLFLFLTSPSISTGITPLASFGTELKAFPPFITTSFKVLNFFFILTLTLPFSRLENYPSVKSVSGDRKQVRPFLPFWTSWI